MTLQTYLQELDAVITAAPEVLHVEILRRSVWDTGMERVAVYRYKLTMSDASVLELTERLVEEHDRLSLTKYRHHWQDRNACLVKRWDNAPHHPDIATFPHHLHDGSETDVIEHQAIYGIDVLKIVIHLVAGRN